MAVFLSSGAGLQGAKTAPPASPYRGDPYTRSEYNAAADALYVVRGSRRLVSSEAVSHVTMALQPDMIPFI